MEKIEKIVRSVYWRIYDMASYNREDSDRGDRRENEISSPFVER
jgi:hypothetical protein